MVEPPPSRLSASHAPRLSIADASSVSYVAGWARADRDVITQAATNVLRAVNTIAAALGLDADEDQDEDGGESAGEEVSAA